MPKTIAHARIVEIPNPISLQGGRLDCLRMESHGLRKDLVMDFHGFVPAAEPLMLMEQEIVYEHMEGQLLPRRFRFIGVKELVMAGLFEHLDTLPLENEARTLRDLLAWRPKSEKLVFFLLLHNAGSLAELHFYARNVEEEALAGNPEPVMFRRDWSTPPSIPARLVPDTKHIYRQFGGDPVSVKLDGKFHHHELFIGGLDQQEGTRPRVDAVLNLGEEASRWVSPGRMDARDRWVDKGEGRDGMSLEEITEEALWAIQRLKAGERVLVHCVAGMNRSATICCAVVMLLEGIPASDALERVRRNHPWARPDSNHWLKLRWLESTLN